MRTQGLQILADIFTGATSNGRKEEERVKDQAGSDLRFPSRNAYANQMVKRAICAATVLFTRFSA